ncbi:MAG: DNA-directed RNA polymerase subunit D [Desulfurococcaceae archaeon]
MEITPLERGDRRIKLYLRGVPLHVVNSIRRATIAEVPTMAVDYVVFMENNTVFYDEYIAHRLGLMPLYSEDALEKYKPPEECAEAGEKGIFSEDCFVKLELSGQGPEDGVLTLRAKDLVTSDPGVKPVYPETPIVQLIRGQSIKLEAYARLGRGKEHVKWSPVSVAAHKYVAKIYIDPQLCDPRDCAKCVDACPKNVLELREGAVVVREDKILDCSLCRLCELACPRGALKVSWREDEYVLTIEATGALSPARILREAVKILDSKLSELEEQLAKIGGSGGAQSDQRA